MAEDSQDENFKKVIRSSGALSRQALATLRDLHLPADPYCYHVLFEMLSRPSPELKSRIEQLSGSPEDLYEQIKQIYEDFISSKQEARLRLFSQKINKLANNAIHNVSDTQNHLKSYSGALEEMQPLLISTSGDSRINVISLLIAETEKIHEKAQVLEERLKEATQEIKQLQNEHLEIKDKVNRDSLTQVLNREGLEEAFRELQTQRKSFPVSVILADIDHFKQFNDKHGHLFGDNVLKQVANTLAKGVKGTDVVARFGGEEFVILLPQTKKEHGAKVADQLRKKIEHLRIRKKSDHKTLDAITLSFGVTQVNSAQTLTEGLDEADKALYRSKHNGRNCVNTM
ncbi:GGDEF domain-containing protein [Aliikangiella sp. G2MR2-5]|uniref:GGDEF domain-containing protein n=1 Tax=Aliikangiella sp. G2MR2-5 TaxID=2788943 RepID=UPI0018A88BD8|nr:GGDEF domain-containing protein [Aliikangiella sp. G2MR2-5]